MTCKQHASLVTNKERATKGELQSEVKISFWLEREVSMQLQEICILELYQVNDRFGCMN